MYEDNVPKSGPITTITWITGVSDFLSDSGFFMVLKSALHWAGGSPTPSFSLSLCLLWPAAASVWTQDGREHPSRVIVLCREGRSLMHCQFLEGGGGDIIKTTSAQCV